MLLYRKRRFLPIISLQLKSLFLFAFIILTLYSCSTRKEVEYFNDIKIGSKDKITYYPNKIQINDILSIKVDELITAAVEPYNNSTDMQANLLSGYLVNYEGNIVFPRLGTIAVVNKTTTEVEEIVNKLLIDKGLVKDPTTSVRIINAKVTVIGAGGNTVSFGGNNVLTILQAVGNISPTGIKNDIVLIREEDGFRRYIKLDITKVDLINSPYYYLKQNDVIYIKPNGPTVMKSGWLTSPGAILGAFSSIYALYLFFKR